MDLDLYLRQHEMMAAHEKAPEYHGVRRIDAITDLSKTGFSVKTDIHILSDDSTQYIANLEVKYMPAGMIRYDAKKIAYQFTHLNMQYPQQHNFIVYGGKSIQKNHSISHLLQTFSDGFFQLETKPNSKTLMRSFQHFCEGLLESLRRKRKQYGNLLSKQKLRMIIQPHQDSSANKQKAVDRRSHTQKKRDGFAFEAEVGPILESMGIDYVPRKQVDVSILRKFPISIELDYSIVEKGEIRAAIECKNGEKIGTTTACNIAFDAVMLRRKHPDVIYMLVLGPDTKKWSSPHLRRYVDWIGKIDHLAEFIKANRRVMS